MPVEVVERTEWDERLAAQYQSALLYLAIAFAVFSAVAAAKNAIFFFAFDNLYEMSRLFAFSTHNALSVFAHFFFLPEYFSFNRAEIYQAQEVCQLLLAAVLLAGALLAFALFERRFFLDHLAQPGDGALVHVFTLEVRGLANIEEALKALEVMRLVCGGDEPVYDYSLVFRTQFLKETERRNSAASNESAPLCESPLRRAPRRDSAFSQSARAAHLAFIEQASGGAVRAPRDSRALLFAGEAAAVEGVREEVESLHNALADNFTGRMFVTFRDYASVRELLVLQEKDKLIAAAESLRTNSWTAESLTELQLKVLDEAIQPNYGYLYRIRLSPAHNLHDFVWEVLPQAQRRRTTLKHFLGISLVSVGCCALLVLVQYYDVYTSFQLLIEPERGADLFGYRFMPQTFIFKLCLLLLPEICQILLDFFLGEMQQKYYSAGSNARFYIKLGVKILLYFVGSFYGYFIAAALTRAQLPEERVFDAFYQTTVEWNIKAALLVATTLLKYIVGFARKVFARFRARRKQIPFDYAFDNAISSSVVITTFLYVGFYINALSPFALLLLAISLFLNWAGDRWFKSDDNVAHNFIAYHNIALLIVMSALAFAVGGVLALHMQFYFTPAVYFSQTTTPIFPMFFFFSLCALAVLAPSLLYASAYRRVGLRLLDFLVRRCSAQELAAPPKADFRSLNPFYSEVRRFSSCGKDLIL